MGAGYLYACRWGVVSGVTQGVCQGRFQMNINKYINKKYENLTLKELAAAPVDAIAGISAGDVKLLRETYNVKTISDLAKLPSSIICAKAICALAEGEL